MTRGSLRLDAILVQILLRKNHGYQGSWTISVGMYKLVTRFIFVKAHRHVDSSRLYAFWFFSAFAISALLNYNQVHVLA